MSFFSFPNPCFLQSTSARTDYLRPANGSLTQPRRGSVRHRQSGAPLAATNVKTAGSVCQRRDAVRVGRKKGLQPRANERPAVGCSEKLAGTPSSRPNNDRDVDGDKVQQTNSGGRRALRNGARLKPKLSLRLEMPSQSVRQRREYQVRQHNTRAESERCDDWDGNDAEDRVTQPTLQNGQCSGMFSSSSFAS